MKRFDNPPREEWTAICQRPAIDVSSLQQTVAAVFSNVAAHGDTALTDYTTQFDGVDLNDLRVAPEALAAAAAQVPENDLIKLTNLEASLLNLFALNPEKIISREMVINGLDLGQGRQDLNERNVDVQITRLRKKIEPDPTNPRHLKTIRGRGYRFLP